MSQIFYQDRPHNLQVTAREASLIVWAEENGVDAVYKTIVFPKDTHYQKKEVTTYQEFCKTYTIKEVLRAESQYRLRSGGKIRVWQEPSYGLDSMREYHEQGLSESPILMRQTARFKPNSKSVILFLNPHEDIFEHAYGSPAEGESGLPVIRKILASEKNPTLFYYEDRSAFHANGMAMVIGEDGTLFQHRVEVVDGQTRREQVCTTNLSEEDQGTLKKIVKKTNWAKLEFSGTLLPDETRPKLYIGGHLNRFWDIDENQKSQEGQALDSILALGFKQCESEKWMEKKMAEVDFELWPDAVKGISQ